MPQSANQKNNGGYVAKAEGISGRFGDDLEDLFSEHVMINGILVQESTSGVRLVTQP
jgi:hypothetical protein